MKDSKTKGEESTRTLREPMHLCTCVSEEGGDGEAACSETPSLLSYKLRYVSFAEVGSVCRVALRKPMHLCTCVSEEGGDGGKLHAQNLAGNPLVVFAISLFYLAE